MESHAKRREEAGDGVAGQRRVEEGQHPRAEQDRQGQGDHRPQADQRGAQGGCLAGVEGPGGMMGAASSGWGTAPVSCIGVLSDNSSSSSVRPVLPRGAGLPL